jgi:capsular polysaccharide transport system permease protein
MRSGFTQPGSGALRHGLVVMGRTLFALILREARVRHGRSRIGYAWALIEPFVIVAVITLLFSGILGRRTISYELGVFYALGVVQFQYFRHASSFIGMSLEANNALLNYPTVHEVDTALARFFLDTATYIIITCCVIAFLIAFFHASGPAHPEWMLLSSAGLGLLALGIGLNLAALQRRYEMTLQVWSLITAPLFFFSALLFSLSSLPTEYRNILLWNPVAHGIEGIRRGWYPDYGDYVDLPYLYFCAILTISLGLAQVLVTRRGLR